MAPQYKYITLTPEQVLACFEKLGDNAMKIDFSLQNQNKTKAGHKCRWHNVTLNHEGVDYKVNIKFIKQKTGMNIQAPKNADYKLKPCLAFYKSQTGSFGQAIARYYEAYMNITNKALEEKVTQGYSKNPEVHTAVQTHYALSNEKNPGEPLEDPIIRLEFECNEQGVFKDFNEKNPVFNTRVKKLDPKTNKLLPTPMTYDGKPVNGVTIRNVVGRGSEVSGTMAAHQVCVSSSGYSMKACMKVALIAPKTPESGSRIDMDFNAELDDIMNVSDDDSPVPGGDAVDADAVDDPAAVAEEPESVEDQLDSLDDA